VASALSAAIEHLCRQANLSDTAVFCLENFGGRVARQQATKVAMESIGEQVKKVAQTLIRWFKAAFNYIKDGFDTLRQGADSLVARARAVVVSANAIAHKTLSADKQVIKSASFVTFMLGGGAPFEADRVQVQYTKYTELMGPGFSSFLKQMVSQVKELVDDAKAGNTKEETTAAVDALLKALRAKAFSQFKEVSSTSASTVLAHALPFGQQSITVMLAKEGDLLNGLHVSINKDDKQKDRSALASEELPALNYEQILAVAKAVEKEMLFGLFKDYPSTKSGLAKIESMVDKACQKITDVQQTPDGDKGTAVMYSVHFLKELVSSTISMTSVIHRYNLVLSKHLLSYCAHSIKLHG
jgi:hypothetical protein